MLVILILSVSVSAAPTDVPLSTEATQVAEVDRDRAVDDELIQQATDLAGRIDAIANYLTDRRVAQEGHKPLGWVQPPLAEYKVPDAPVTFLPPCCHARNPNCCELHHLAPVGPDGPPPADAIPTSSFPTVNETSTLPVDVTDTMDAKSSSSSADSADSTPPSDSPDNTLVSEVTQDNQLSEQVPKED